MPENPTDFVAEILGEPSPEMRNPANAEYQCPFINGECTKRSQKLSGPYPICSARPKSASLDDPPIIICPKRFFEANLGEDIIRECWMGTPPTNPRIAYEIKMAKFGNVDLVVADVDEQAGHVRNFLPVEIQAVDMTGSLFDAYEAITSSHQLEERISYGFNWANVRKRFINQLISKGYYCHHWGTRIIAVLQSVLFERLHDHLEFGEVSMADSNVVFMLYTLVRSDGEWNITFDRLVPTTHNALMTQIMYKSPPDENKFKQHIINQLQV